MVEDVEELQKGWIDHLGHGNQNAKKLGLSRNLTCKSLGSICHCNTQKKNEGDQELDMQVLGGLCVIAM